MSPLQLPSKKCTPTLRRKPFMKFRTILRRCRFNHNEMSQQQLADAVGVTRQTISSIERGKFVPSALLALKVARYFNVPVEEIFFIEEEEASCHRGKR